MHDVVSIPQHERFVSQPPIDLAHRADLLL